MTPYIIREIGAFSSFQLAAIGIVHCGSPTRHKYKKITPESTALKLRNMMSFYNFGEKDFRNKSLDMSVLGMQIIPLNGVYIIQPKT